MGKHAKEIHEEGEDGKIGGRKMKNKQSTNFH
jgi:hypothetical protein